MKKFLLLILTIMAAFGLTADAQTSTNEFKLNLTTNAVEKSGKTAGSWEFTLGGSGEYINGKNTVGGDFSLCTNPFEKRPEVYLGIAQGLYWEPQFAGSTDLFADWSQAILPKLLDDSLYFNIGWSGGALYDNYRLSTWRTGPEASLQYYLTDNSFIFTGVNYDIWKSDNTEKGWRYSFGIGFTW